MTGPETPSALPFAAPDADLLVRGGWAVAQLRGPYCTAFRGAEEAVFVWRAGDWHRLPGRASGGSHTPLARAA